MEERYGTCNRCQGTGFYRTKIEDKHGYGSGFKQEVLVVCDAAGCHGGVMDRLENRRSWALSQEEVDEIEAEMRRG